MSQQTQIALDPSLNLTPEELTAAWNASPEALAAGTLMPERSPQESYLSSDAVVLVLQTAVTIASTLLADLLYDLLKEKFYPQKPKVVTIDQGDGRPTIVITIEE